MLVSGSYPNLVNGVSQQARSQRLSSQGTEQINAVSSVVHGLGKRPPTQHVKVLGAAVGEALVHVINRDETERYVVLASSSGIRVFDTSGTEKTVTYTGSGSTYLSSVTHPRQDIRLLTLEDTTVIVNKKTVTAMSSTLEPAEPPEAIIWIQIGVVDHVYTVTLDTHTVTFTQSSGLVDTTAVATALTASLLAITGYSAIYSIVSQENLILIKRIDLGNFNIAATDTYGNQALSLIKNQVAQFSELPATCWPDIRVHVSGDSDTSTDDYYTQFEPYNRDLITGAGLFGRGIWVECVAPAAHIRFDASTMPHTMVRNSDGTFTVRPSTWSDKDSGDDISNLQPSFIGQAISDVFVFQARLGFLSEESIVMSTVNDWFNFWRDTVVTLTDDSPIDTQVGGPSVSDLRSAVPFHNKLLLFSDQTQFTLEGDQLLTPKTVSVTLSTAFEGVSFVRPVNAGNSIFFAYTSGGFSGVREYYVQDDVEVNDAADITSHVPTYIDGTISSFAVTTTYEMLLVGTDDSDGSLGTTLFPYQWKWLGTEKVQSAWSSWTFHSPVVGCGFINNSLYILFNTTANGLTMERMDLNVPSDSGQAYITYLDRRVLLAPGSLTYDASADTTSFVLPYLSSSIVVAGQGGSTNSDSLGGGPPPINGGEALPIDHVTINTPTTGSQKVYLTGDQRLVMGLWVGIQFTFSYTFSPPYVKAPANPGTYNGGTVAVYDARVQLLDMTLVYENTSYFRVTVQTDEVNSFTSTFTGRLTGSFSNTLGTIPLPNGGFNFAVRARNEVAKVTVVNDSFLPSQILSAEWRANYVPKSRRI